MKFILGSSLFFAICSIGHAQALSEKVTCVSRDLKSQVVIRVVYQEGGAFVATSSYDEVELKAQSPATYNVLEGWDGDIDNNRTIRLTLSQGEYGVESASLMVQKKIDRVGYETTITPLRCHVGN